MTEAITEPLATPAREGHVGTITLTRKGNNSIAPDLGEALVKALEELENDPEVRVIVVRSGYEKYFSVGADLTSMASVDRSDRAAVDKAIRESVGYLQACFSRLEQSPKVVIAAINGHALGGGCELALACDYRIMVNDGRATIGQTEINLGIIPGAGGTQRLPRLIGRGKAIEMMLEGTRVHADEAERIGLVNQAVASEEFEAAVRARAEKLAAGAPVAQALTKRAVNEGLGKERIEDALEVEMKAFVEAVLTDDAVIGIMAFFSKQTPEFTGK
ncbi:MAG: enoyl-CoA hydratase/isomerase family protein [Candidatus Dormibacteraeota bacterium]|nr:enoyl-CoA hydratase/isomerase family protein [Candidatus Dormibacteraeota bacterium]